MAMRFQLQRRPPQTRTFYYVTAPRTDLGKWIHPTKPPTLGSHPRDRWTVKKPVVPLDPPAVYRFRVTFRWFGADRRILQTVVRLGKLCNV